MQSDYNRKSFLGPILLAFFYLFLISSLSTQDAQPELKAFKITLAKQGNEVVMQCTEGCAWTNLTYRNFNSIQAINELGMTSIEGDNSGKDETLADFLFTITITEAGLKLKGIRGTAFKNLGFHLRDGQKQVINQMGMVADQE